MIKITWCPTNLKNVETAESNIVYFAPEPAFAFYQKQRPGARFLRCPAFSDHLKNTFIIRSPYDIEITFDPANKTAYTNSLGQEFYDDNIEIHDNIGEGNPTILSLMPRYVFVTDSKVPVKIVSTPLLLHPVDVGLIPGEFDITKWVRLVSYDVEIYDSSKPLVFKRGDPLFMVRFIAEDGSLVQLNQGTLTNEIKQLSDACVKLKLVAPNLNLKSAYSMAASYVELMKKRIFNK